TRAAPPPPPTPAASRSVPRQQPLQRTSAPTDSPNPVATEQPAAELDALARRLIAPLSRLLRAELRGDRERIGRLRDR
ncbi:hypothetical protein J0695_28770, partial [Streptomyces beijiangensis]|nr:hypothetical protein [Streptomyces beijiangensis]